MAISQAFLFWLNVNLYFLCFSNQRIIILHRGEGHVNSQSYLIAICFDLQEVSFVLNTYSCITTYFHHSKMCFYTLDFKCLEDFFLRIVIFCLARLQLSLNKTPFLQIFEMTVTTVSGDVNRVYQQSYLLLLSF